MKVLIVDDHPVLREGLAALLRQGEPETIVLQAQGVVEALSLLEDHLDLDIVVLDLRMPGMGGLDALATFGGRRPTLPVIVLSASEDPADARAALARGALGYVPKSAGGQTLISAIQLVLGGDFYIPPLMLGEAIPAPDREPAADLARLTERQVEVLRLLGEGRSNKAIALALGLSEKTVKVHVTGIFRALDVANRTQAAGVARELGLI